MTLQFLNNITVPCTSPVEQKFITDSCEGWFITFSLNTDLSSSELDSLLTDENISSLTFVSENGDTKQINGYTDIKYAYIRFNNDLSTRIDIQLSKNSSKNTGD